MSNPSDKHGIIDSVKDSLTKLGQAAVEGMHEHDRMHTGIVDEKLDQSKASAQDAVDKTKASASDAKKSAEDSMSRAADQSKSYAQNATESARGMAHDAQEKLKETSFKLQEQSGLEDSTMKGIGAQIAESGRHAMSHVEKGLGGGTAAADTKTATTTTTNTKTTTTDTKTTTNQPTQTTGTVGGIMNTMTEAIKEDHVRMTGS